jgi:hypothetical protein
MFQKNYTAVIILIKRDYETLFNVSFFARGRHQQRGSIKFKQLAKDSNIIAKFGIKQTQNIYYNY